MKERTILFSGPMVLALLKGRKTQTRRLVKRGHVWKFCPGGDLSREERARVNAEPFRWERENPVHPTMEELVSVCPFGKPGDRLWVRERLYLDFDNGWSYDADRGPILSGWGDAAEAWVSRVPAKKVNYPSIHMPRWACRLVLEVTGVRVERVGDISDDDALAEGVLPFTKDGSLFKFWPCDPCDGPMKRAWQDLPRTAREAFLELFYGINKRAPRDTNPWVWVVEFRRVKP